MDPQTSDISLSTLAVHIARIVVDYGRLRHRMRGANIMADRSVPRRQSGAHVARIIVDSGVTGRQPTVHTSSVVVDDCSARSYRGNRVFRLDPAEANGPRPHHQRHERGNRQDGHDSQQRV
jgi:hypothetical protein